MYFDSLINLGISLNLVHSGFNSAEPGDLDFNLNVSPKEKHYHNGLTDRSGPNATDRAIYYDHPFGALIDIDHSTCAASL